MSKELRSGCEERYERRLIDVSPRRVKAADNEVELVTEKPVMRICREVQNERSECGDRRNA
jgi:hypothetical protein